MHNDRVAWIDPEGTLSYAQIYCYALDIAKHIRNLMVPKGAVIAICGGTQRLHLGLVYATQILGCPLLPLNPNLPLATLTTLLAQTHANCLITDIESVVTASVPITIVSATALINMLASASVDYVPNLTRLPTAAAVQLMVATSGSEGHPKAVMLTGRNIAAAVVASNDRIPLQATDRWLLCLPLYHIGGLAILYRCAAAGAAVVVAADVSGTNIATTLLRYTCTHVSLVPAILARLLDVLAYPPPKLRCVLVGGAALSRELAYRALSHGWPLCISYGMSETGSQIATLCYPKPDWPGQLVGLPLRGVEVRIDNTTTRIQVRGDVLMAGYANIKHPVNVTQDGWFTTADTGRLDNAGQLWIYGRADQMLISGGNKVHPTQIEALLAHCPGIIEVAVGGKADPLWGQRIIAVFVGNVTLQQVASWCRNNVSGAMRPRGFIKVPTLPRTALGKIDYAQLRIMIENNVTTQSLGL